MKNVVITGGTGFIGKRLTLLLQQNGYLVTILTRNKKLTNYTSQYSFWDVENGIINANLIRNTDCIIHLAGEGIAERRWTNKTKIKILESRTKPLELIYKVLKNNNHSVKTLVSASGINFYGTLTTSDVFVEEDFPANDFLGKICEAWEKEVDKFSELSIRTVKFRTGIVLDNSGGALPKMTFPFKYGLGCMLGNGKQFMPWISLNDLCNMYLFAIENDHLKGAYNATVYDGATNEIFNQTISQVCNKKIILPSIPSFILRLIFGKMADLLLYGSRVDNKKIKHTGFVFSDENLKILLYNLLKKRS